VPAFEFSPTEVQALQRAVREAFRDADPPEALWTAARKLGIDTEEFLPGTIAGEERFTEEDT